VNSSPFHEGERAVQARAGARREADRVARIVAGEITDVVRVYLATMQLAVLATLDESGQPWASLLTGPQGFPEVIDGRTVALEPEHPLDPILASNLRAGPEAGMLGMDVSGRRRRVRVNGEARLDPEGRCLILRAREVFANCPRYIQAREELPRGEEDPSRVPLRRPASGGEVASRVRATDTFFVASHSAAGGADASHRGGMPGFVRASQGGPSPDRTIAWDDYPGNNLFQTLGNVHLDPRVGLLFVDFEDGSVLQVAGEAELRWDGPNDAGSGTGRTVLVRVREAFLTEGATPRRWRLSGYSPHNPEP
jgi:predicted pyridoxine 5'-phosphate oxidase superfamily flavin-nucleotide-binding protein